LLQLKRDSSASPGGPEEAAKESLRIYSGSSCTSRLLYEGPFRETSAVSASLLCSMAIDSGKVSRRALLRGYERD
jgi:hypothetical protein